MAKGFNHGAGGGTPLNFKVVGNPQPANPKENTIWVNTDTEITGWIFSATEPEGYAEGMVWIKTGAINSVEFNALKKNTIKVYPMDAKQYLDGAWVAKPTLIYQNGVWRNFYTYLYDNGTIYPHIAEFVLAAGPGYIEFNDADIKVGMPQTTASTGQFAVTNTLMDLSSFSTLVMKVNGTTSYGGFTGFGVSDNVPNGFNMKMVAYTDVKTRTEQEGFSGVYTCDISAVDRGYLFFGTTKVQTAAAAGSGGIHMTECYLF